MGNFFLGPEKSLTPPPPLWARRNIVLKFHTTPKLSVWKWIPFPTWKTPTPCHMIWSVPYFLQSLFAVRCSLRLFNIPLFCDLIGRLSKMKLPFPTALWLSRKAKAPIKNHTFIREISCWNLVLCQDIYGMVFIGNLVTRQLPIGPVTANGVDVLTEMYVNVSKYDGNSLWSNGCGRRECYGRKET